MAYTNEYLDEIIAINLTIEREKAISTDTIQGIKDYLAKVKELGAFSPSNWPIKWRKEIYKFGEHFKELSPEKIFEVLDELIEMSTNESEKEVLEFFKIEVFLNFFTPEESIEYLEVLISKYRLNPEFKNSLAIFHLGKGNVYLHSKYLKQALKLDRKNEEWLDSIYKEEYSYGKKLISDKKHDEADTYIQGIIDSKFYKNYRSDDFQNFFIFLKQRNDDQLLIENKLLDIQDSSKEFIDELFEKSRIKVIEILGFFTAIIAFIFGTITISVSLDLSSAIVLLSSFGFSMIVFTLALSLVFTKPKESIFKDQRMLVLIMILLINLSLIFMSPRIVDLIQTINK